MLVIVLNANHSCLGKQLRIHVIQINFFRQNYPDFNDCEPNPCLNGGSCEDEFGGYTCHCSPEWIGENCTVVKGRVLIKKHTDQKCN